MKVVIIILIFLFSLLKGNYILILGQYGYYGGICLSYRPNPVSHDFIIQGQGYQCLKWLDNASEWNTECIKNNFPVKNGNEDGYPQHFYFFSGSFCKNKKGYAYSAKYNAWFPTDNANTTPICPSQTLWDSKSFKCAPAPKCPNKCLPYQTLDPTTCTCKCTPPLINDGLGHCVPNPDLDQQQCEKAGGIYMKNNILDTFSSVDNAIASLYAPPGEHYCYSKNWINYEKQALKAKFSPKEILSTAIALTPIGRLFKIGRWAETTERVIENIKDPKLLQDNRAVIDTKYNPNTGTFEPVVHTEPRETPLSPEQLFNKPSTLQEAEKIVKPAKDLDEFLKSKFIQAERDLQNDTTLNQAVVDYDLDTATNTGEQVKTIDDLRDLFKKSKLPKNEASFPVSIKNYVGEDDTLEATAVRKITPISTTGNTKTYNVIYNVTLKGATTPATISYEVEVSKNKEGEKTIRATPTYKINNTNIKGDPINLTPAPSPVNSTSNSNSNNPSKTDFTSFKNPAEQAIKQALDYKINLFSCPDVTPECPHAVVIHYNLAGLHGDYNISDPLCAVIKTINQPKISPLIDNVANLIVLFAGVFGFLTLLRRD